MGVKRCIESPLKDRFCVRWHVLGLMKLDKSIFKGVVPIVMDRNAIPISPAISMEETMYVC